MAAETVSRAAHNTLSGTTVDEITISDQAGHLIEVANRSGTATIFFTTDGSTPTDAGNNTDYVMPGESLVVVPRSRVVKLIGNGNAYSVTAVDER